MEKVKRKSLKAQFFAAVAVTLAAVAAASALTVWGCWRLRQWLVPRSDGFILTARYVGPYGWVEEQYIRMRPDGREIRLSPWREYKEDGTFVDVPRNVFDYTFALEDEVYSIYQNGPRRGAAYIAVGVAMAVLPAVYAIGGSLLCALWFYRRRIAPAVRVLDDATEHISGQDLDFAVSCPEDNELGRLCRSFEGMRRALYENNLQLWRALESRRTTMSCVAHDLRNPLAIMEGTLEHLRTLSAARELTGDRLEEALTNLTSTAKRMERYTDYIRDLDAIEDTELNMTETDLPDFLRRAAQSVRVLAGDLEVEETYDVPECRAGLDVEIFYRVLENIFSNAARYARRKLTLSFTLRRDLLTVRVADDGPGFSAAMLRKKNSLYYSEDTDTGHMGLGLATGKILCEKHGGTVTLSNAPASGAVVEASLTVRRFRTRNGEAVPEALRGGLDQGGGN